MYSYCFDAYVTSNLFNASLFSSAVPVSQKRFNALRRKKGRKKFIEVCVDVLNHCLHIELYSDVRLEADNYLRAAQYFSKVLAKQPGMSRYITSDGRLLTQTK